LTSESGYAPKTTDIVGELGCGVGRLTRAIAPKVGKEFEFDLLAEMLAIARSSVGAANASFHCAEARALGGNC
jgi:SAM-dependent methyltransferase